MKKQIIGAFFTLIATPQKSLLVLFCTFLTFVLTAQREPKSVRDDNHVIKAMTKRVDKIGWLYYKDKTKKTHQTLVNDNKDAFGLTANDIVKVDREESDAMGGKHQRLKQYYKGIEVENASYVLHFDKKGYLTHSNGELGEEIDNNTNTDASISEKEALEKAVEALDGLKPAWTNPMLEENFRRIKEDSSATYKPKGKLLLVLADNGKYKLAYTFGITTSEPMQDWYVYIDARNKQILKKVSASDQCFDLPAYCSPVGIGFTSRYNGEQGVWGKSAGFFSNYAHLKTCNNDVHNQTCDISGASIYNVIQNGGLGWGTHHQQYTSAHWAAENSWLYFQNTFSRYGWDNNFQDMLTLVDQSGIYEKLAVYSRTLERMQVEKDIMSLDVMGHEFTHGISHKTANLDGTGEPGALGESFSDIFGAMINRYATGNMVWNIGTQIPWASLPHGTTTGTLPIGFALNRDLKNPGISTPTANASIFNGANWVNTANPSRDNDFGGIHTNCGVQNRWFSLLAEGGNQNGVTVQGIGIENAAKIAYYNLTTQLTSSATFQSAVNGALAVAESFFGCGSNELEQTRRAWQAVGVITPQPQLRVNGGGGVQCTDNYDTEFVLEACWRYGATYWWTVPSQFTTQLSGSGNNVLRVTIPAYYTGSINISVYAAINGFAPQQLVTTVEGISCGGPNLMGNNANLTLRKQFSLSPNPTSGIVSLDLPNKFSNAIFDSEVYNALGQLVYSKKISGSSNQLEVADLPKGLYNVVVKNASNKEIIFSTKFTKI
jgi:Zn-dependent metalloprotease